MKKNIIYILLCAIIFCSGCSKNKKTQEASLKLWLAPSSTGNEYWEIVIDKWNKSGLGMKVTFETIPAVGSTEEAIFNGIVSETIPDISANIFPGFGAQLYSLGAVYDLKEFDGFDKLIAKRKMERIIKKCEYEGKIPMFPTATNPMLIWWRKDLLKELGYNSIPKTYDDVYELAKKLTIPKRRYLFKVFAGKNWWSRTGDFIPFYYAASEGKEYIRDNTAVLDNEYSKDVLNFFKTMVDQDWTMINFGSSNIFYEGVVLGEVKSPWDIGIAEINYPELIDKIQVGPILTPKPQEHSYTVSDTKGLVIFKSCKYPEEAWKFINWVYENDEFSKLRIEKSRVCPARGDLMTNPIFSDIMKNNKMYAEYAKYVNYSVTRTPITKTMQVQKVMTSNLVETVIFGEKTIDNSLKYTTKEMNKILKSSR
jgi:multiple sugar transport system substrate-binding protein